MPYTIEFLAADLKKSSIYFILFQPQCFAEAYSLMMHYVDLKDIGHFFNQTPEISIAAIEYIFLNLFDKNCLPPYR